MSSLSPILLVVGLILVAVGGALTARTVRWIFKMFPKTFSPTAPTARPPVEQAPPHKDDGLTRRDGSQE